MISLLAYTNFTLAAMQNENIIKIKTIVIDAGHGGKDAGAVSKNGIYKEKDIALSIALKFGAKIKEKYPDIKVIYTRDTDRYIELGERAAIANRNKADLFISIHINSTKGTVATGTETFVMGTNKSQSNFEICKTENSVIVLEDDYQSKYEGFDPNSPESYIIFSLLQNTHLEQSLKFASYIQDNYRNGPIKIDRGVKQGGLLVLWKATMPAVLTEVGFISNSEECMMLTWDQTQNMIASRLLDAFSSYKNDYESFQGVRTSKTEFISCPGCGRTLFNLQDTVAKVKASFSHLKTLKIGVMGCIVNGPGEMADADYGYVGAEPGKISLYKKKERIEKNIPEAEAVERLIALIKKHGDWVEP